ncbi:four helix bundle protein [Niabella drilacis]|uniref:Four helix bundle protein n=1 Tax=Niabella drilacis (strain DSM 25811 / CCM 8410 / CCUG 62505 / LMG 26954 / E90) TaxID=1285928 RepID=A0A1G6Q6R1_NIADE|nr:four helix bundle protein [Niabella drilacis]SDC87911.1 four helix bundle protein [Niabella drilacis]
MGTVSRFEDLEIGKLARELSKRICSFTLKELFSKDQIRGSSGSAMDNIAEGFKRSLRLTGINFPGFVKGTCGEVKFQLYRALDLQCITGEERVGSCNQLSTGTSLPALYLNDGC